MDKPHTGTAAPADLDSMEARGFWGKVDVRAPNECWAWKQSLGNHGYGQTWDGITVRLAHRIAYELAHGPIPPKMTVDHICHNRPCCNPGHLRILSNVDNARDNGMATRTHCPKGHEYTPENTYIQPSNGSRKCRKCVKLSNDARPKKGPRV